MTGDVILLVFSDFFLQLWRKQEKKSNIKFLEKKTDLRPQQRRKIVRSHYYRHHNKLWRFSTSQLWKSCQPFAVFKRSCCQCNKTCSKWYIFVLESFYSSRPIDVLCVPGLPDYNISLIAALPSDILCDRFYCGKV